MAKSSMDSLLNLAVVAVIGLVGWKLIDGDLGKLLGGGTASTATCDPPPGPYPQTAANLNFPVQLADWRRLRAANGEDCHDWAAFRTHELALGAPDIGTTKLKGF